MTVMNSNCNEQHILCLGDHHNLRNCSKGLQQWEPWEPLLWSNDQLWKYHSSKVITGVAGEMVQKLSCHAEDLGLVPCIHTEAHNYLQLHFQEIQCPLLICAGTRHTHGRQIHMRAKHSYTQNKSKSKRNHFQGTIEAQWPGALAAPS